MRILMILLFFAGTAVGQTNTYSISFNNAVHHEAKVKATFPNLDGEALVVRMSRTSPGRYALHEFAKNVYALKATDSNKKELQISRPDPYSWEISGHNGTVNIEYTLFANRADGTYSQVDETHAHLNIPATFIYSEDLKQRPIEVTFDTEAFPDWKIATQLKYIEGNKYMAPDLDYFMDSPTEISNFDLRQYNIGGVNIRFALHHTGTAQELDQYFEKVKEIVVQQKEVYGELPDFDYNEYTFLACYMPHVSGDGMEHRNSTVLTSTRSLGEGGMKRNLGTVAHEFFHVWNVERIRPESLEPFDFTEVNMSEALWFAEGFTSYYTGLVLVRAEIITQEEYLNQIKGELNYVWNSPAREFFNPIELSYQAPFVDAATSVDPVNWGNTFISYYSYGSVLGLALDLTLREQNLNLDEYMALVWKNFGKPEIPYSLKDLENILSTYAGKGFADEFYSKYIYDSKMPNYERLFEQVGIKISRNSDKAYFGPSVKTTNEKLIIASNPQKGSPAYQAGLDIGDEIISVDSAEIHNKEDWENLINTSKPGDIITLSISRHGKIKEMTVQLLEDPSYLIKIDERASERAKIAREKWLSAK